MPSLGLGTEDDHEIDITTTSILRSMSVAQDLFQGFLLLVDARLLEERGPAFHGRDGVDCFIHVSTSHFVETHLIFPSLHFFANFFDSHVG